MSFKNVMPKFHSLLTVKLSFLPREHECQESMAIPKSGHRNTLEKYLHYTVLEREVG